MPPTAPEKEETRNLYGELLNRPTETGTDPLADEMMEAIRKRRQESAAPAAAPAPAADVDPLATEMMESIRRRRSSPVTSGSAAPGAALPLRPSRGVPVLPSAPDVTPPPLSSPPVGAAAAPSPAADRPASPPRTLPAAAAPKPRGIPKPPNIAPRLFAKPDSEMEFHQARESQRNLGTAVTRPGYRPVAGGALQDLQMRERFALGKWFHQDHPKIAYELQQTGKWLEREGKDLAALQQSGAKIPSSRLNKFWSEADGYEARRKEVAALAGRYRQASIAPNVNAYQPMHTGMYQPEEQQQAPPTTMQEITGGVRRAVSGIPLERLGPGGRAVGWATGTTTLGGAATSMLPIGGAIEAKQKNLPVARAMLMESGVLPPPIRPPYRGVEGKERGVREWAAAREAVLTLGAALKPDGTLDEKALKQLRESVAQAGTAATPGARPGDVPERARNAARSERGRRIEQAVATVKGMTPYQRKSVSVLKQQQRAEAMAFELAGVEEALFTDIAAEAVGELAGLGLGRVLLKNPAIRARLKQAAPRVFAFFAGASDRVASGQAGEVSLRSLADILATATPRMAASAAVGAPAGGLTAYGVTRAQGGTHQQGVEAGKRGALMGGMLPAVTEGVGTVVQARTTPRAAALRGEYIPPEQPRPTPQKTPRAKAGPVVRTATGEEIALRETPRETLIQVAQSPDPQAAAAAQAWLDRIEAWDVQSDAFLPPGDAAGRAYKVAWGKSEPKQWHDALKKAAETAPPDLAAKLSQAAQEANQAFVYNHVRATAPENAVEPTVGPPTVSVWRQLTPEERASLPDNVRRSLLALDLSNSLQTIHPERGPINALADEGNYKNTKALQQAADETFATAQGVAAREWVPPVVAEPEPASIQPQESTGATTPQAEPSTPQRRIFRNEETGITAEVVREGSDNPPTTWRMRVVEATPGKAILRVGEEFETSPHQIARQWQETAPQAAEAAAPAVSAPAQEAGAGGPVAAPEAVPAGGKAPHQITRAEFEATGEPLMHGTSRPFAQFDPKAPSNKYARTTGFFFTDDPMVAHTFADAGGRHEAINSSSIQDARDRFTGLGNLPDIVSDIEETGLTPEAMRAIAQRRMEEGRSVYYYDEDGALQPLRSLKDLPDDYDPDTGLQIYPKGHGPRIINTRVFGDTMDLRRARDWPEEMVRRLEESENRWDRQILDRYQEVKRQWDQDERFVRGADRERLDEVHRIWDLVPNSPTIAAYAMEHGAGKIRLKDAWESGFQSFYVPDVAWIGYGQDPHKAFVMKALAEGQRVPAEVLADYPELQQLLENVSQIGRRETARRAEHRQAVEQVGRTGAAKAKAEAKPAYTGPERRTDAETRKRVGEMTPEEKDAELLTSKKAGIPNDRAYWESEKKDFQAILDVDGLGWVNKRSHVAGDAMIRAFGDILKRVSQETGAEFYHISGDEFVAQGADRAKLDAAIRVVQELLPGREFSYKDASGTTHTFWGMETTYAIGPRNEETGQFGDPDYRAAYADTDELLEAAKQAKQEAGRRAPKGERPPGLVDVTAGEGAAEGSARLPGKPGQRRGAAGGAQEARAEVAPAAKPKPAPRKKAAPAAPAAKAEGTDTTFKAGDETHTARWAVYEASDLVTSHTDDLTENPAYPKELQPRDRTRQASREQVAEIAQKFDPSLMGQNPLAQHGAPIVGPDGAMESGNGRTIALRTLYGRKDPRAKAYQQWLTKNAGDFGLNPADLKGIRQPVLVRVRTSELTPEQRVQFTRTANARETAAMGAVEQARADAERLTPKLMTLFDPGEAGDIAAATNRPFVRAFIEGLPTSEQAALRTAEGGVSSDGLRRIRNAVFQYVYGDTDALTRLAEAVDDPARNVTNGMLRAAGHLTDLQRRIDAETAYPVNVAEDVAKAAVKIAVLREQGTSVSGYLAQMGMFGEDLTPLQRNILVHLDANKRSAKRIAATLADYVDLAIKAGDPGSGTLFEDIAPPEKTTLWQAAVDRTQRIATDEPGLFAEELAGEGAAQAEAGSAAPVRAAGEAAGGAAAAKTAGTGSKGVKRQSQPQEQQRAGPPPKKPPTSVAQYDGPSDPDFRAYTKENRAVSTEQPLAERVKEKAGAIGRWATREFPSLPNTGEFAVLREKINAIKPGGGRTRAADEAVFNLQEMLDGLNRKERTVFSDLMVARNLVKGPKGIDAQRQMWAEEGKDPAAFEPVLAVPKITEQGMRDQLDELEALAKSSPKLTAALQRMREVRQRVTGPHMRLAKDVLGRDMDLDPDNYLRNKVIAYQSAVQEARRRGGKFARLLNPSYARARKLHRLPSDTDFATAEMDYMPDMLYDNKLMELYQHVRDEWDITPQLARQAIEINDDQFTSYLDHLADVAGKQVLPHRAELQARNTDKALQKLSRMAAEGTLPDTQNGRWKPVLDDLAANHQLNQQREAQGLLGRVGLTDEARKGATEYAQWLRDAGAPAGQPRRRTPPATRAALKKAAGKEFVDVEDLIPEGYREWKALPGSLLHRVETMPQHLIEAIAQGDADGIGAAMQAMQEGKGLRRPLILKREVADTLDSLMAPRPFSEDQIVADIFQGLIGKMKGAKLTFPPSAIDYFIHNLASDMDRTLRAGGIRGTVGTMEKWLRRGAWEVGRTTIGGKLPTADLREYFRLGGRASLQTQGEGIGSGVDLLGRYTLRSKPWLQQLWQIGGNVRNLWHDARELAGRYSLYLYLRDYIKKHGKVPTYGASPRDVIDALLEKEGPEAAAFRMAQQWLIDYDETSAGGQFMARYVYPFFRYQEGSWKYEGRLFRNALTSPAAAVGAARKLGFTGPFTIAYQFGRWALLSQAAAGLTYLANQMLSGEDEEKLDARTRTRPHLTFTNPISGNVETFNRFSSFYDTIAWYDLDDIAGYNLAVGRGMMTQGDVLKEMGKSGFSRFFTGLAPQYDLIPMLGGAQVGPDIFRLRKAADPWEAFYSEVNLDMAYRWAKQRPQKKNAWTRMAFGTRKQDFGDNAFQEMRSVARDWLAKRRKADDFSGGERTAKTSAAKWFFEAVRMGDEPSARFYLGLYAKEGGDDLGLQRSKLNMEPLGRMQPVDREAFLQGLLPEDVRRMRRAYYHWAGLVAPEADLTGLESYPIEDFVAAIRKDVTDDIKSQFPVEDQMLIDPTLVDAEEERRQDNKLLKSAGF